MQKLIQPPTCLDHGLHALKPQSFPPIRALKNTGETSIVLWITARDSRNQNQKKAALWRIFHQIKVRQPIGRQDFIANRDPNMQEVGFIFA
jgi:hypothetical protein